MNVNIGVDHLGSDSVKPFLMNGMQQHRGIVFVIQVSRDSVNFAKNGLKFHAYHTKKS
jgi:hypothetical protein